mmetsp:Transcript_1509/g.3439  ORF Transcript_1509/g.3439 Transcript_1509/m.3439 type:complete len:145 (-) Transcript_1509:49-483(-)
MEWHPAFAKFQTTGSPSTSGQASSKLHSQRRLHDTSYDFGTWGISKSSSLQQIRSKEASASATFFRRTVAPSVVERLPRARSIGAFPGFDPDRDRNYFDYRPSTGASAAGSAARSPTMIGQAQSLQLDALEPRSSRQGGSSQRR